jgi:two-component system, OmpR family, sensor histidine kinase PhoQ
VRASRTGRWRLAALSLTARLLLAASLVLAAFLGFTGFALDKAFRASAEAAVHDRLQGQLYALLAAADPLADGGIGMRGALPEARLAAPGSGLYAAVSAPDGTSVWRSPSLLGTELEFTDRHAPGAHTFARPAAGAAAVYLLSFGVAWEEGEAAHEYTFHVAEHPQAFEAQVADFRRSLWGWLGAAALVLLAVQGSILRWSLAPLRRAAADLAEIEAGHRARLEGEYPPELRGLTDNLNALLQTEHAQQERYRTSLGDLAHSLKTPLAVLRGAAEQDDPRALRAAVQEQVARMTEIVHYRLQRAATSGRSALAAPVAVEETVRRVAATVAKVYADKAATVRWDIVGRPCFYGDRGDLLELCGNLLDNAFKYGRSAVTVGAAPADANRRPALRLWVEDDGPGIPPGLADAVLERGVRGNAPGEGQGIGLAVVRDIVWAYGGSIEIGRSTLGGARVTVHLPG